MLVRFEDIPVERAREWLAQLWLARRRHSSKAVKSSPGSEREQLRAIRDGTLGGVDSCLATVDETTGFSPEYQRELLYGTDFDPSRGVLSVRTRRRDLVPWSTSRGRKVLAAVVAVVVVAAATTATLRYVNRDASTNFVIVSDHEWQYSVQYAKYKDQWRLTDWPTTGELTGNTDLLEHAAETWMRPGVDTVLRMIGPLPAEWWPHSDAVNILFAGRIQGSKVVLMGLSDGVGRYPRVARFVRDDDSEHLAVIGLGTITDAAQDEPGGTNSGPIPLLRFPDEQVPVLVPPWLADLSYASPNDRVSGWAPLKVHDGLAAIDMKSSPDNSNHCAAYGFVLNGTFTLPGGRRTTRTYVYNENLPYMLRITAKHGQSLTPDDIADSLVCGDLMQTTMPPRPIPAT